MGDSASDAEREPAGNRGRSRCQRIKRARRQSSVSSVGNTNTDSDTNSDTDTNGESDGEGGTGNRRYAYQSTIPDGVSDSPHLAAMLQAQLDYITTQVDD
ncbi:hypothetical protein IW150_005057, partial [Coemansia sp. RSA 2607]